MNRWRWITIFLTAAALFLILGAVQLRWDTSVSLGLSGQDWRPDGRFTPRAWMEHPPTLLSTTGALMTTFLSGILLLFLFPKRIRVMERAYSASPGELGRLTLLGLLAGLLLIALAASSAVAMSTLPLTIVLASLVFLGSFAGFIALAYTFGRALLTRAAWSHLSPLYALLLGLLILFSLMHLPLVGIFFQFLFFSLSIGVMVATRLGSGQPWNLAPLLEE